VNLAGVSSGATPATPVLFGAGLVFVAAEWLDISDHGAPVTEWPVTLLELLAAAAIVASVVRIRRAQGGLEPRLPEHEENFA
jgi:hypothetical protein